MKSNAYIGRLLAVMAGGFFGWLAGAHFSAGWSWVGMLIGAVLFAVLENPRKTWHTAREVWKSVADWRPDWSKWRGCFTLIGKVLAIVGVFLFSASSWTILMPFSPECSLTDQVFLSLVIPYMSGIIGHLVATDFLTKDQMVNLMPAGALFIRHHHTFGEVCRLCLMLGNIFSGLVMLLLGLCFGLFQVARLFLLMLRSLPKIVYFILVTVPKWAFLTIVHLAQEQKTATGMIMTAIGVGIGLWCGRTLLCGGIAAGASLLLVISADALAAFAKRFEKPPTVAPVAS